MDSVAGLDHAAGLTENWATGTARSTYPETLTTIGITVASHSHGVDIQMVLIILGVTLELKHPANGVHVLTATPIVLMPISIVIYHLTQPNRLSSYHSRMMRMLLDQSIRIRLIYLDRICLRTSSSNPIVPPRLLRLTF